MADITTFIQRLKQQGISHPRVLEALEKTPRDKFVAESQQAHAYEDNALPIDCEQTISQPYIVARMTEELFNHPHPRKILEVGTGSGYQAAILAFLFEQVWTIERIDTLYGKAKNALETQGYPNIQMKLGDGTKGWSEFAPYDGILVTAAPREIPKDLIEQLNPDGGVLVIPVGPPHQAQRLMRLTRHNTKTEETFLEQVCFVPLI